jgi:hypothetical protein
MMQGFGVDERELYRAWIAYIHGLAKKVKAPDVIKSLRDSKQVNPRVLDYFTVMGMNLFLEAVGAEATRREHASKS